MKRLVAALCLSLLPASAWAQGTDENHRKVYEQVVDSVVAIRALAPLGERSGTGVILTKDGLVLTSYAVVPDGSTKIRVWTKGPRLYDAELVGTSKRDEIAVLRIKAKEKKTLPEFKPMTFGDSSKAQAGDVTYTIGNASNCMINDDSPSLNVGVISGSYRLSEPKENSHYVGMVLETTAAVNVGMEGAPLLDNKGRMIGFVTLNYSASRFLGAAIPWAALQGPVDVLKDPRSATNNGEPEVAGEGYFGATFADKDGQVVVETVEKGTSAELAGLEKGVVILAVGQTPVKTTKELLEKLKGLEAGSKVFLKVSFDGLEDNVAVELQGRKK